jgi:hypothetical protein
MPPLGDLKAGKLNSIFEAGFLPTWTLKFLPSNELLLKSNGVLVAGESTDWFNRSLGMEDLPCEESPR